MADISEELLKKLNVEGVLSAKDFASMLLFDDDSDIKDIKNKFKKNFLDKFKSTLNEIKKEDIKRIFDPLNLSGLLKDYDSLRDEFKDYKNNLRKLLRKSKEELEKNKKEKEDEKKSNFTLPLVLNDTKKISEEIKEKEEDVTEKSNVIEFGDSTKKFFSDIFSKNEKIKNKKTKDIEEQEQFISEKSNVIEFGDSTKKFFSDIFKKTSEKNSESLKDLGVFLGKSIEESSSGSEGSSGILDFIGAIVAGGLLLTFWNSHIRPWLEEKFDFMNKLKGTFNGIEKFIYTTLPRMALDLVSGFFKRIDDIVQVTKNGIIKMFSFGGKAIAETGIEATAKAGTKLTKTAIETGVEVGSKAGTEVAVEAGGKAATKAIASSSGGLLARFGSLFGKAAKFIPGIGAILSFGFAWDRFEKGDKIGGVIDVIGGLGNLLELTVIGAPIGAPLSWAAIGLNAFLDITSEGKTEQNKSENKGKNIMKWISAPFKWISSLPWIKSIMNFGEGIFKFTDGVISGNTTDTISGLKMLQNSFLSPLADALLPIYESNTLTENKIGNKKFDWANIWKDFTNKMLKSILPDWIYNMVAPYIIGDGGNIEPIDKTKITNRGESLEQRISTNKKIDELRSFRYEDKDKEKQRKENIKVLDENIKALDEIDKKIAEDSSKKTPFYKPNYQEDPKNDSWPHAKLDDGEINYNPELKIGGKTVAKFSPQDAFTVIAGKQGGEIEKMGKMIANQFQDVNNKLIDALTNGLNSMSNNNSVVNINNSSNSNGNTFSLNTDMVLRTRKLYMDSPRALA
jgi:hypothetical protein